MCYSEPPQLPDFLSIAARAYPSRAALAFGTRQWSFAELERAATSVAASIAESRSPDLPQRRVGILSANRPGFVFAVHAAARAGVSLVPLNWRQTAKELAWQIADANISVLLVDEERMAVAREAIVGLPVSVRAIAELEHAQEKSTACLPAPPVSLGREALVMYTSGTSGRPKGARLTYGNLWFSAIASSLHIGLQSDDSWLAVLPLFHIGGLSILYRGAIGGTHVVLHDRFDPERVSLAIERDVTLASLVPTMLPRLIEQIGIEPWSTRLRNVLIGGGPAPPELLDRCIELGIPVSPTYGLTETASQVTTLNPGDVIRKAGSSGLPLPTTEIRIANRGKSVGNGNIGGIEVRGPTLFSGYLGYEEDNVANSDGWFATGDDGFLDEEGFLYVVDRRQDVIISGGENVYPAEVERVLQQHPSVTDAGVVAIPTVGWGQRPLAAVVWAGNDPENAESLLHAHCQAHLAAYKTPDRVIVVNEIPRTPSGKLLRRTLREMLDGQSL